MKFFIFLIPFLLFAMSDERGLQLKIMKEEQRIALVIGNSDYLTFSQLKNPINDAKAMKKMLEQKDFTVYYKENATQKEFIKLIKQFSVRLSRGGVGLFYFAGHGIQVNGENYLIAADSAITEKDEVLYEAIALNYVTKKMKNSHNRFNIIILDACRNDPFSRSGGGGLAPLRNARGIFVAYATEAGGVAMDGADTNGVFTKHLIKYMDEPLSIEQVFKRTRRAVYEESHHEQFPGVYNQAMGDFYFTFEKEQRVSKSIKKIEPIKPQKKIEVPQKVKDKKTFFGSLTPSVEVLVKVGKSLQWQDDSRVLSVKKTWSAAQNFCNSLVNEGKMDWRLPTYSELASLVDYNQYNPAISDKILHSVSKVYWSKTRCKHKQYKAWGIHFRTGVTGFYFQSRRNYVRCVRSK